jgi:hypothetical protein
MAQPSPEEYRAAAREDGIWPGDYDYGTEQDALRRDEEDG